MASVFEVILEEFEQELDAISVLIGPIADVRPSPRVRVAVANAAVLLLAATFEEFVRELARAYARAVVAATATYDRLPPKIASIAWKRTMEGLARMQLIQRSEVFSRESLFSDAQTRFAVTYEFCRGDLTQDIYRDLIHNENNIRPQELNSLFKLSGLSNICLLSATNVDLKAHFGEDEQGVTHGKLLEALEDFFDRRNDTAHAIGAMRSVSPEAIATDIGLLRCFGKALAATLEQEAPAPIVR